MATLEKPKKKSTKNKQAKNRPEIPEIVTKPPEGVSPDIRNDVKEATTTPEIIENVVETTSNVELENGVKAREIQNVSSVETTENLQKLKENVKILTYPELPSMETSQIKMNEASKSRKVEEIIKPFTEAQLTALYTNQEIEASKQFIRQFTDTELRGVAAKKHPLYELITGYLKAREKLKQISIEVNQLRNDAADCQTQMWVVSDTSVSGKASCLDGAGVSATHPFKTAKFQRNTLESFALLQKKIKRLSNYNYTLHSYNCCLFKLKIEYYLDTLCARCEKHLKLSATTTLLEDNCEIANGALLQELRLCISVLFYFQRQLHKDKDVLVETRNWLTNMISLLLRNANWQDHMYLLNHVLRCPAGINTWAVSYIQVPGALFCDKNDAPFADRYVNHIIAVLSVILMPIDKRDAFLQQIISTLNDPTDMVAENLWVLVDSDGESDDDNTCGVLSLKENDLVSLLNQIPLDYLFRAILQIERKDNEDILEVAKLSEHHILRLFAFSTVLVKLINNGLATYATARYNQFAKRLCRLMRHVLQYASDAWEICKSANIASDRAMLDRLQVEFDAFFMRTTLCLFSAHQTLGSWQFLAVAPFHMVSIRVLWRFFYVMHQDAGVEDDAEINIDYKQRLSETSQKQQFYERLSLMSVEQAYYLLNTFGNMIMARDSNDMDFIQFATLNLLQIGFTEIENQESSRKCAAILLSNITQKYPALMSDILAFIRGNIQNLESLVFLFSELPLYLWRPTETDFDVLSSWLLENPVNSVENFLARKILLNLNYSNAGREMFLPLEVHRQIAVLTLDAVEKHVSQIPDPENSFVKFAWTLVFQLRLHATDRNTSAVDNIPDLIRFDVLQRGIRQKMALALYCAIAMTTVGHLLPLVCGDGLAYLLQLAHLYKHDAVITALYYVVPLFLENIEALLMCSHYQDLIVNLLNADKTYYKMAKSLISVEFPGGVLRQFACLIQMHLHNPQWRPLFVFWVKSFTSLVPQWHLNKSCLFLLNCVVSVAFFIPDRYKEIELVFKELLSEKIHERNNSSSTSSLLSWVPLVGGSQSVGSSVLLQGYSSDETWFMYLVISLEHQEIEVKSGLWAELLRQLHANKGKTNVDASLKKAANILKIPSYTSNGLCIYRWCQLALDTPLEHPLLTLIWQKFFSLYLIRVPGLENSGSVGNKFFDGVINTNFLKRIKKRLQESVEHVKQTLDEAEQETSKEFLEKCLNIFKAYVLWLEEPILMEATLYFPSLPPQYEPRYLAHIIQNTTSPWMEFINYEEMRKKYEQNLTEWLQFCNRASKFRPPLQQIGAGDLKHPVDRVLRRLTSYDKPIEAPKFKRSAVLIPGINVTSSEAIPATLQPHLKKLQQHAEIFALQVSEYTALDSQYKELIPQLYQNVTSKVILKRTCKPTCTGVANIRMIFTESRMNESVKHQLETNRNNFASLLLRCLQCPPLNMCVNCASLEQTIDSLIVGYRSDSRQQSVGTELFYYLFDGFNDDLKNYPPTQQMFHNCLEKLGAAFLTGVESESLRLLRKIIQNPGRSPLLIPQFNVANFHTDMFLQLYQEIASQVEVIPDISLALISKFDVGAWLAERAPRLVERSRFISILFDSLARLSNKKHQALQEAYRRHLLTIFQFDFPTHYGEILQQILTHSAAQTLLIEVWLDVINALAYPLTITGDGLREVLRQHATTQQLLKSDELTDTISMLARFFSQERHQFGLYGLYPKYRVYIEPLCVFFGLTFHAYTVAILNASSGELADNLVALHLWPKLVELFGAWLLPYSVKDASAAWIQQLTDDRAVLLPWIQADVAHAQHVVGMFVNCILFVADTLPASSCLLCYLWQFYALHFAHAPIKEHILMVIHSGLMRIRWETFWPTLTDLEIMLKVLDQYLPECHAFLGKIFLEVNWSAWLTYLMHQTQDCQIMRRAHHCLLHLLVKLSNEPTVRQNDKARTLLERSREFGSWFLLDVQSLDSLFDWYIMSCDPRVLLLNSNTDAGVKQIDCATYQLLRIVSYYNININELQENTQVLQKRQCFIRAFIKILINCSSRYKNLITANPQQFSATLTAQLDYLETILNKEDSDVLIREFLAVVNNPNLSQLSMSCVNQSLENRGGNNVLVCSILRNVQIISDDDVMSCVLEQALNSYFSENSGREDLNWEGALQLLDNLPPRQKFETILISNGRLLTLYAILLKKIRFNLTDDSKSCELLLEMLIINWLMNIKGNDLIEDKLPLFWVQVIRLSLKLCHFGNEEKCAVLLRKFVHQHLLLIAENKGGASESNAVSRVRGFLGAMGLIKQNAVTMQCRFLCRSMGAFILAQLPDTRNKTASVRCFSGAANPVGQPGGNAECAKILLKLEPSGCTPELRPIVETSLKQVQDPQNSLHTAENFLFSLLSTLYTNKIYLQRL